MSNVNSCVHTCVCSLIGAAQKMSGEIARGSGSLAYETNGIGDLLAFAEKIKKVEAGLRTAISFIVSVSHMTGFDPHGRMRKAVEALTETSASADTVLAELELIADEADFNTDYVIPEFRKPEPEPKPEPEVTQ